MLICVHRATEGSGWLIKTQVLYEHTLSGHNPSGHRQAGTLRAQVIFLLFEVTPYLRGVEPVASLERHLTCGAPQGQLRALLSIVVASFKSTEDI